MRSKIIMVELARAVLVQQGGGIVKQDRVVVAVNSYQ